MLHDWLLPLASFAYLGLLFAIAWYGDRRADAGRSLISNPYIYTLSIAVYCTAWTFYGSVGRAAGTGVGFLPIYLGPTLMALLWWFALRKLIRISKQHRLTSIADFIASRYGKSTFLGGVVTLIAVIGIMPYISLQLKAVSTSFNVLQSYPEIVTQAISPTVFGDTAFYVALVMTLFAILFGTRHIDVSERHEGMVAAIAFESVVKLLAFLAVGLFVSFGLFDGPWQIFEQASARPELQPLMLLGDDPGEYLDWLALTFLAMMAIIFLPRQFQVAVVENVNEEHLRKAAWLFPLYLLLINLFVLPIAFGGLLHYPDGTVDPDTFVLTLPLASGHGALATFVYLGGLSAATGMVIVATIALSTMICNDLVMPVLLRIRALRLEQRADLSGLLLGIRRGSIVLMLVLGYIYFRLIGESYALVSLGLLSFAAAAQFAPPILTGLYWKQASRAGALAGLLAGFTVWAYTLLLPAFALSGWIDISFVEQGLFGIHWLRPYALFGLTGLAPISHTVFWSMLCNVGLLVGVSLFSRQSLIEQIQATLFVDVFRRESSEAHYWGGTARVGDLRELLSRFLGSERVVTVFERFATHHGGDLDGDDIAVPALLNDAERELAGAIGAASARIMMATVVQGEALSLDGMLKILDETTQVIEYSRRLEQKSVQLEKATTDLQAANERLQELDRLKDEFVSTVSHELRTPLTSIRAFSEILLGDSTLPDDRRNEFLGVVVRESERLTRLVNQVLDITRMDAGRAEWEYQSVDLVAVIDEAATTTEQLFHEREVVLDWVRPESDATIEADRDRMIQVIINLLSNAVKFSPQGHGRVTVRLEPGLRWIRVSIADNGPGIPPDQDEHVFDRFHQVVHEDGSKPQGSGLGLAITRRIVEYHGGTIAVDNDYRDGARFIVVLPVIVNPPATDNRALA
ncbi:MAG: histidine kinase [Gammaproteobacteria bacterium]|nr:MAG: histidine kinase [Gammaproteobacteria bacterium]